MCCSYSACGTTLTVKSICAWYGPQRSAHLPLNVPTVVGVTWKELTFPEIMSSFIRKAGIQNEWLTSRVVSTKRVDLLTGRYMTGGFCWSTSWPVSGVWVEDS